MCDFQIGYVSPLNKRAIVRGIPVNGKERPILIITDTAIFSHSMYGSTLLGLEISTKHSCDYDIPIMIKNTGIHNGATFKNTLSFIQPLHVYRIPSYDKNSGVITGICPEQAFQLAMDVYNIAGRDITYDEAQDIIKRIDNYSVQLMKSWGIEYLEHPTAGNAKKRLMANGEYEIRPYNKLERIAEEKMAEDPEVVTVRQERIQGGFNTIGNALSKLNIEDLPEGNDIPGEEVSTTIIDDEQKDILDAEPENEVPSSENKGIETTTTDKIKEFRDAMDAYVMKDIKKFKPKPFLKAKNKMHPLSKQPDDVLITFEMAVSTFPAQFVCAVYNIPHTNLWYKKTTVREEMKRRGLKTTSERNSVTPPQQQ